LKRDIVGSIFPENLCFDGGQHRTARVNDLWLAISLINKEIKAKKKREDLDFSSLPASVVRAGIEPATQGFSVLCSTD
jgi:site-specific DNA recombinase